MLVRDLIPLLDAELIYGSDDIDIREIHSGCGSDMMSDVLAFVKDQPVLLTGLCNPQVIRTAEMMIELARERGICLLATPHTMFTACGILYKAGLVGGA